MKARAKAKAHRVRKVEEGLSGADQLIAEAMAKHPAGLRLKGASTLLDADGNVIHQWVKSSSNEQRSHEILEAFRTSLELDPLPPAKRIAAPKKSDDNLMCVIPIGDMHMGMLAWAAETGEDWDMAAARRANIAAMRRLIELSPECGTCVIINLGDGLHADGYAGTTTAGTRVDVDSRWPKMLEMFLETMNECVQLAAAKHKRVIVLHNSGNHDAHAGHMVGLCQAAHFRGNSRIEVSTSPSKFKYVEHGRNLIGTTHGDSCKFDRLPGIMAVDKAEAWGRCNVARHWYLGHYHSRMVMELGGCIIETFRTLAPKDAWHTAAGYRSGRSMICDVWHKQFGRSLRHEVHIESVLFSKAV